MREQVRADALQVGDRVLANGQEATVQRAKVKGKRVLLTLATRRGSFDGDVKAKTLYDRLQPAGGSRQPGYGGNTRSADREVQRAGSGRPDGRGVQPSPGPLHAPDGSQNRWATMADLSEPADPRETTAWTAIPVEERALVEELGAKLLGVEVEGGKLVVPPVTDGTVLAHLLTMHGVRFDGATFDEAKAWAKANPAAPESADEVLDALTMKNAYALHDRLHAGNDLAAMPTPHWHRERAPK